MKMSVHLNFNGNCRDAFELYQKVFGTKSQMLMTYAEAPGGSPVPAGWNDKILHTSIAMGEGMLMGCDTPPDQSKPLGGFQVSVASNDQAEVKRVFDGLQAGGSVQMPLNKTFWSPLFGMCTDKFGVGWMVGVPGEQPPA